MEATKLREIISVLDNVFKVNLEEFLAYKVAIETKNPFETLVATILTQNTNEKNAFRAYYNLKRHYTKLEPMTISRAEVKKLSKLISVGGLGTIKAKRIVNAAKYILEKYHGNLWKVLKLGVKARSELMKIPGVGPKTADILLLMVADKPTIPVDTHIMRVTYRLGLVDRKDYETVRKVLMDSINPRYYLKTHLLLILLGRRFCLARNPKCSTCPVNDFCPKIIK